MTEVAPKFNAGRAWAVTVFQILGSVGFGLGMFRAMTTYMLIIVYFNVNPAVYGSITGIVALFSLITAIPGGLIMSKIGARNLALLCLGLACLGNILATVYLLIAQRGTDFVIMTLLGIPGMLGWGAMSVAGTALVSAWFPPKKRPLPMGCCGMFVPLSMLMVQFLSTPLINMASMDGFSDAEIAACFGQSPAGVVTVTVAFTIYILVVTILAFFVIRDPKPENSFLGVTAATEDTGAGQQAFSEGSWKEGFANLGVWLVVIVFFCYSFGSTGFANYWPTYIESGAAQSGFGVAPATATMYTTAVTYSMIAVSLIVGYILTKISRDYWWILILIVTCAIWVNDFFLFQIPGPGFFVPFLVVYGCTQELWPCITYTLVPEMVDTPKGLGAALGVVSFMMNITGTVAGIVYGFIIAGQGLTTGTGSWNALSAPLVVLAFIAVVAGVCLIFYWRKRWATLKARAAEMTGAAAPAATPEA